MMRMTAFVAVAALSLGGCGMFNDTVVSTPPARCSELIPDSWSEGVESEPVPDTEGLSLLDQLKAWAAAYVGADAQLEKANGRTTDTIQITRKCEELVNGARPDRQ